jgi:hypothetical protein
MYACVCRVGGCVSGVCRVCVVCVWWVGGGSESCLLPACLSHIEIFMIVYIDRIGFVSGLSNINISLSLSLSLSLSSQVRRHAVGVLSQLLAEDFIKLRGSMFFRLAQCLGDHDARVRALAEQVRRLVVWRWLNYG